MCERASAIAKAFALMRPRSPLVFASASADALARIRARWESQQDDELVLDGSLHAADDLAHSREATQRAVYEHVQAHQRRGCWQTVRPHHTGGACESRA